MPGPHRNGDGKITSSNGNKRYDGNEWRAAFQKCELKKDPDALNVYIYDAYDEDNNASDTTRRGNSNISNNYQAFILLDYNRLLQDYSSGNSQRPSSHEVGHFQVSTMFVIQQVINQVLQQISWLLAAPFP